MRNFRNFPKEIHRLNNRPKPAKHAAKTHISTNPQDSSVSSSFNSLSNKEPKMKESPVENGGKVEKAFFERATCGRQVYASAEVARGMVVSLNSMGIAGEVQKCPTCRLIHVVEFRA